MGVASVVSGTLRKRREKGVEDRGRRSEIRSQTSEVGGQRSDDPSEIVLTQSHGASRRQRRDDSESNGQFPNSRIN